MGRAKSRTTKQQEETEEGKKKEQENVLQREKQRMVEGQRKELVEKLRKKQASMTLFQSPVMVMVRFGKIVIKQVAEYAHFVLTYPFLLHALITLLALFVGASIWFGSHMALLAELEKTLVFTSWYIGLGIASSIGLGTGLHTFVLYIGPHVAQVTLAASLCNTLDFELYGPEAYECLPVEGNAITISAIFWQVQWIVLLWGIGTAIGELPPYFISRAASYAGKHYTELDDVENGQKTWMDQVKLQMFWGLQNFGFWAILAFASIPNPLFDLAGVACGHFHVPFWTFFGATLIGKALVKAHLQTFVVILIFYYQSSHIDQIADFIINFTPSSLHDFVAEKIRSGVEALKNTYVKKHEVHSSGGLRLGMIWDAFLALMLAYFLISIINSSVQTDVEVENDKILCQYDSDHMQKSE